MVPAASASLHWTILETSSANSRNISWLLATNQVRKRWFLLSLTSPISVARGYNEVLSRTVKIQLGLLHRLGAGQQLWHSSCSICACTKEKHDLGMSWGRECCYSSTRGWWDNWAWTLPHLWKHKQISQFFCFAVSPYLCQHICGKQFPMFYGNMTKHFRDRKTRSNAPLMLWGIYFPNFLEIALAYWP